MKHAFVTGATGFIGHHLCRQLVENGYRVTALVRDPSRLDIDGVEPVRGELTRPESLHIPPSVDTVFHLAGITKAVRRNTFHQVNSEGTRHVLAAVRHAAPNARFIYVSSLAAAGPAPGPDHPVTEEMPPRPVSAYGASKLAGERYVADSGLDAVIIRPPAVFGEWERDIYTVIRDAARGRLLVPGRAERRFSMVYGPDLVRAMIALAGVPHASGETFFVAYRESFNWTRFRSLLEAVLGQSIRVIQVPEWTVAVVAGIQETVARLRRKPALLGLDKWREIRQRYWICSSDNARKAVSWVETPVETALTRTVAWYRQENWL